jgi:hypothetical protein
VRNGFENLKVTIHIKAQVGEDKLEELCRVAQKHSPVFDIISKPVPVSVRLESERPSRGQALPDAHGASDSPESAGERNPREGSDGSPETGEL